MMSRIGVALIGVCLVLYLVVAGQQAILFIGTGQPVAVGMGVALLVLPAIGLWALVREMQFGFGADRLGRRLDAEGGMPEVETELTPSGRIVRGQAEPLVARYEAAADADPEDWRSRFRLGVVQDAAGRRKDARASIRAAIRLEKSA